MKVSIKSFDVKMDVKTNGIEFEVRDGGGKQLGDCYLTQAGLIWCKGKTTKQKGVRVSWNEFIKWMEEE